eukprot:gene6307-biopygen13611
MCDVGIRSDVVALDQFPMPYRKWTSTNPNLTETVPRVSKIVSPREKILTLPKTPRSPSQDARSLVGSCTLTHKKTGRWAMTVCFAVSAVACDKCTVGNSSGAKDEIVSASDET